MERLTVVFANSVQTPARWVEGVESVRQEGRVVSIKDVEALATMPSKEELMSKLLFLINAPAQRLVTVMNAIGRDLAVVINQGVEKNKFSGGEAASA